jgi:hypothetical protein
VASNCPVWTPLTAQASPNIVGECLQVILFERAQLAEDAGDIAEAERLYRVLMHCDPTDSAPPFNHGNMLRTNGRKVEAEAALRAGRNCAVRCRLPRTTPTRCSILRFCYSEPVSTRKRRSAGGNILPMMLNLNGQHAHVDP